MIIDRLMHSPVWSLLGWTMLHFLWMGSAAGLMAAAARFLLRGAAPAVRYGTALAFLAFLTSIPMVAAAWLVGDSAAQPLSTQRRPIALTSRPVAGTASPVGETTVDRLSPLLARAALYLPWLWIAGTPLTLTLLAGGLAETGKLRRTSRPLESGQIASMCEKLAGSLSIVRRVGVALCDDLVGPVLVGILRPVILLPTAALSGWGPAQWEMVLLHELAHVRRWDNLVNLLQRAVESVLFFHPAVWWTSQWVRRERESCCDCIVVDRTGRPRDYAELLAAVARRGTHLPRRAMALGKPSVVERIRHILQLEEQGMRLSWKALCAGVVVLAASTAVLPVYAQRRCRDRDLQRAPSARAHSVAGAETNKPLPPKMKKSTAVEAPPKGTVYLAQLKVFETDADGKEKVVAAPTLMVPEGKEATLLAGGEVPVPDGDHFAFLPFGHHIKMRFHRSGDKVLVNALLQRNEINEREHERVRIVGNSVHLVETVALGSTVSIDLSRPGTPGRVEMKVEALQGSANAPEKPADSANTRDPRRLFRSPVSPNSIPAPRAARAIGATPD